MHGNRLYIISRSEDGTKPFIPLPLETSFTFLVQILSSDVYAMSNLPFDSSGTHRYVFSNRTASVIDGKHYLYPAPPLFDATPSRYAGEFVRDAQDECHECLVDLAPGTSALGNAAQWRPVGKVAYASAEHLMRMIGPDVDAAVTPAAAEVAVSVFGFNPVNGQYDVLRLELTFSHEAAVDSQRLSLRDFLEGIYRFNVNGIDSMVFYRPQHDWYDAAGLVRIVHGDSVPATHRLLNNDGSFAHPLFSIRIAPRNVLWQYQARSGHVKNVLDSAGQITFASAGLNRFRSTLPHRLREIAYNTVAIEYNDTDPIEPSKTITIEHMEVPGFRNQGSAIQNGTTYITSQVFLNY